MTQHTTVLSFFLELYALSHPCYLLAVPVPLVWFLSAHFCFCVGAAFLNLFQSVAFLCSVFPGMQLVRWSLVTISSPPSSNVSPTLRNTVLEYLIQPDHSESDGSDAV